MRPKVGFKTPYVPLFLHFPPQKKKTQKATTISTEQPMICDPPGGSASRIRVRATKSFGTGKGQHSAGCHEVRMRDLGPGQLTIPAKRSKQRVSEFTPENGWLDYGFLNFLFLGNAIFSGLC